MPTPTKPSLVLRNVIQNANVNITLIHRLTLVWISVLHVLKNPKTMPTMCLLRSNVTHLAANRYVLVVLKLFARFDVVTKFFKRIRKNRERHNGMIEIPDFMLDRGWIAEQKSYAERIVDSIGVE